MRAGLGIQALLGHAQPLHRPAAHQVFRHNLGGVLRAHVAVPDGLRVNHHRGPVLALVQAAGFVDPHPAAQPGLLGQLLQPRVQIAFSIGGAGGPRRIGGAELWQTKTWRSNAGKRQSSWSTSQLQSKASASHGVPGTPCYAAESLLPREVRTPAAQVSTFPLSPPGPICENGCLTMSTDNLLSLKDDMVAFIEGHGLHRLPGYVTDDIPSILWEGHGNPDAWKDFVEMAKHVGAPFVTFSEMTLEREELDALIEEAGEMNFPDEEATELVEAKWLRKYAGMLGYIQLGFVYQGLVFLHETTTEWYERYPVAA